jgi:hypothetical protein
MPAGNITTSGATDWGMAGPGQRRRSVQAVQAVELRLPGLTDYDPTD